MISQQHSLDIETSLAAGVWQRWIDVTTWPEDDPDTKAAFLDAEPALGVRGRVIPNGGPKSKITVTRFEPMQAFYLETPLPLATMSFEHDMKQLANGQTRITHRVVFTGLLAGVFRKLIGKKIAAGFPTVMQLIVSHVKE